MPVGLVIVSHSGDVARGVAALAAQMAPSVALAPAGGTDDGDIGTSFDLIAAAIAQADTGDGAAVLYDLGSALLTAETAIEFLDPDAAERVRIVDAPLVEGAIAAAVEAEGGGDLDAVCAAAVGAASAWSDASASQTPAPEDDGGAAEERTVDVVNPLGLHARPAAEVARAVRGMDATVRLTREGDDGWVDITSVLTVVGRAFRGGDRLRLAASGPGASRALDAVAALIAGGFGEAGDDAPQPAATVATAGGDAVRVVDGMVTATPGATGLALGPVRRLDALPDELPAAEGADADAEGERLQRAVDAAVAELEAGGDFAAAHAALVSDPALRASATPHLADGAASAWWRAVGQAAAALEDSPDELIAARAVDMREAGAVVLRHLGVALDRLPAALDGAVVLADDLGPAEVPTLRDRGAVAAVLAAGSATAHAVIVARGLGFPLVLRTADALADVADGRVLAVDGDAGTVRVDPPEAEADALRARIDRDAAEAERLRAEAAAPVVLAGGVTVLVAANVGSVADARAAVENGADAVGLLRTELLVLDRPTYPDEDAQAADLAAIFDVLGDRPVTVRVLDAGGDKPVATLDVGPEHNGFLGVRGLRYLLQHPDLLHTQLRAVLRAAHGHRVSVMAPMVTVRDEAQAFREAVDAARRSLEADGVPHAVPEGVGIMVEVPAAALYADQFAGVADFFSVGSNDLTAYTMAAERTEPGVAELLDAGSPAIGRLLDQLCAAAGEAGIHVAVCGEMAADTRLAAQLVARGVTELSMAPARIPHVKASLRETARTEPRRALD